MNCKHLCLRTKKGIKYYYCRCLKKEVSIYCYRDCMYKEYKKIFKSKSHKSNAIKKMEKNRESVFTKNLDYCYLCGKEKNDLHEIFGGRNRINSIKYNFVLPLCRECHSSNQDNAAFNRYWHIQAQLYWEEHIGTKNDFIKVFGRNYL